MFDEASEKKLPPADVNEAEEGLNLANAKPKFKQLN